MRSDQELLDEVTSFLEMEALLPEFSSWTSFEVDDGLDPALPTTAVVDDDPLLKEGNSESVRRNGNLRRFRYRLKLKCERDELHRLETELTRRLHELLKERHRMKTTPRTDLVLSKSFWKDVAFRLLPQRLHAEAEKKRLTAIVNAQVSYIKTLGPALSEHQSMLPDYSIPIACKGYDKIDDLKWLRLKSSDATMYEIYLQEVNDAYARIDKVFDECSIDTLSVNTTSSIKRYNPGQVGYLQYVNKFLLPCTFENASRTAWNTSNCSHRRIDREDYEDMADSGNTIAFKFRLKKMLPTGSTVSILKRVLARRFQSNNCVVIVWKIFSEGEGIFSGMDVDATTWSRIQPYSEESHSGALAEVCTRQVPVQYISDNADDSTVKAFQAMLHDAVVEDVVEVVNATNKAVRTGSTDTEVYRL